MITEPAVFEVSVPTEVSEFEHSGFKLFPNPSNGNVTISAIKLIYHVEVIQLDGRVVMSNSANGSKVDLDLTMLSKGVYMISVHNRNGRISSQLLMVE